MSNTKTNSRIPKILPVLALVLVTAGLWTNFFDLPVAQADFKSCSITQNGVDVKDQYPPALSNKASREKETNIKFVLTLASNHTYSSYDWEETIDGVKQGAQFPLTSLIPNKLNAGNQFIEENRTYPGQTNKVSYKVTVHYYEISGATTTKSTTTYTCATSFKPHNLDTAKSTFTGTLNSDGQGSTLKAKVVDTNGIPFVGTSVVVGVLAGSVGKPTITPTTAKTDSSGMATFTLKANYTGKDTYSAGLPDLAGVNNTGGYPAIDHKVDITYTKPALVLSTAPKQNFSKTGTPASGTQTLPSGNSGSSTSTPNPVSEPDSGNSGSSGQSVALGDPVDPVSSSSSSSSSNSSGDNASASNITTESTSGDSAPAPLIPSPDILKCTGQSKILYFNDGEPTYDRIGVNCNLKQNAVVTAHIYNKSYDVKSEDNSANLIRTLQLPQLRSSGNFAMSWDGYDDYDQAAALDDYNLVVEAKLDNSHSSDISIQKFKVDNAPDPNAKATTGDNTNSENTNTTSKATDTTSTTDTNSTDDSGLHGAANEPENNIKVTPTTPSKCPGVNYPTDIAGSALESLIKLAYDSCIIQGYVDGTFRENANLTRAEAAKIAVLGAGHIAKQGCYDSDCGSPFMDLQMWQGPWVRAAWDLKMVVGVGPGMYAPNRNITKAEASSLLTKAFAWAPHIGCYNAGCGAGYPDDLFQDIIHMWEGPYLRALWDKKTIHSETPHLFYPDKPITRGQFIEMTMKARIASPNITAVTSGTGALGSTTAGGTGGTTTSTPAK